MKDRLTRDGVVSKLMSYTFHTVKEKKGWGGREGGREAGEMGEGGAR